MKKLKILMASSLLLSCSLTFAGEVNIAVAGNFFRPLQALARDFEYQSGDKVNIAVGSSGKLYAQISNGAPFEIFLSADQQRASKLVENRLAVKGSQYTYAKGKLVLWSSDPNVVDNQGKRLISPHLKRLAIANPKVAPYGEEALNVLKSLGIYEQLQEKIVFGQSIGQAFQYVSSSSIKQGIIALSQVTRGGEINEGSAWIIPSDLYQPIQQDVVLLNKGKSNPVAIAFLTYLKTADALKIIHSFGYEVDV
ncbi:molybdate ABC transporter substrate-binding protein [Psychromonas marina]|uniref:Molybdate ABC transporter substrate-binding protein n=1 Tax=Psychromonas marina TaxID=88364 RepID=A0ABQ6E4Z4_9GAMM|nr:molybdate ABC transporter substrate-binding protein [Psychromonas marina]GLS92527.1 molybdate ABC transporter substrate-binding protein [Psychromonas marina]